MADGSFELGAPDWCAGWGRDDDLSTKLTIDRSDAHHGQCSARWLVEPELGRATIRIPLPLVDQTLAGPHCLSVALRASSPQALMATISNGQGDRANRWDLETRWRRFDCVFARSPKAGGPGPALILTAEKTGEPWALWIDSVKVEAGPAATAYRPADVPQIGVSLGRRQRLFLESEPVHVAVGVRCPASQASGAAVRWTLAGGPNVARHGRASVARSLARDLALHTRPLPRGRYRLVLKLIDQAGKPLTRRIETFGVVRNLSGRAGDGFSVVVPPRGPRSDAVARQIGLTIADPARASAPSDGVDVPLSTRPGSGSAVLARIGELTAKHAAGKPAVIWSTAWEELLAPNGCWQPAAVAVNTWIDLLADLAHLRSIRLGGGAVVVEVFSSGTSHVAVVSTSSADDRVARLDVPLNPAYVVAMDAYGTRLPVTGGLDRFSVELSPKVFYLTAGSNLTSGRFALQLEEARLLRAATTSAPRSGTSVPSR